MWNGPSLNPLRQCVLFASNGGTNMPESTRPLVERIARVLAGAAHSSNAEGADPSAGEKIDLVWREHVNQALAVLHTMREPDQTMAAAGDADRWRAMVEAAIGERVD
jgi:Ser/Thr protein kinase RdoA (MazF antagonist)